MPIWRSECSPSGQGTADLVTDMRTRFAGKTDVGLLRDRNEDSFLVFPEFRFAAVADGMGGHLSGDIASSLAITTLKDFYRHTVGPDRTWPFPYDNDLTEEENCVVVGVRLANQHVFGRARRSQNESGMGTTVVAVMFTPEQDQVIVGHVGDSRCYRIRDGQITQLTSDHSLVSEVTEIAPWLSEEEVSQLPSNVITRALGMGPDVVVDLLTTETRPGDAYLLCSDGLNGMLTDEEILSICDDDDDLEQVCSNLVSRANAAGGNDNTTVVLVQVEDEKADEVQDPFSGGAIELIEKQGGLEAFVSQHEPTGGELMLDLRDDEPVDDEITEDGEDSPVARNAITEPSRAKPVDEPEEVVGDEAESGSDEDPGAETEDGDEAPAEASEGEVDEGIPSTEPAPETDDEAEGSDEPVDA